MFVLVYKYIDLHTLISSAILWIWIDYKINHVQEI
jgi:hypothetical protein